MYRALVRSIIVLSLATLASVGGWWWYGATAEQRKIADLEAQKQKLEQEKQQLQQVVERLGTDKRVADVVVLQREQAGDQTYTTLLFVEYDRTGKAMPPKQFRIGGNVAHVEAMVIEFAREHVVANDPLKGHAIALFTRIFGETDTPAYAPRIDTPGQIPAFYAGADAKTSEFETKLWDTFWKLESDEALRKQMGVRVAVGKAVWGPFEPETLYTLTLTPDGNLSRTAEPMRGVYAAYIDALRQQQSAAQ